MSESQRLGCQKITWGASVFWPSSPRWFWRAPTFVKYYVRWPRRSFSTLYELIKQACMWLEFSRYQNSIKRKLTWKSHKEETNFEPFFLISGFLPTGALSPFTVSICPIYMWFLCAIQSLRTYEIRVIKQFSVLGLSPSLLLCQPHPWWLIRRLLWNKEQVQLAFESIALLLITPSYNHSKLQGFESETSAGWGAKPAQTQAALPEPMGQDAVPLSLLFREPACSLY